MTHVLDGIAAAFTDADARKTSSPVEAQASSSARSATLWDRSIVALDGRDAGYSDCNGSAFLDGSAHADLLWIIDPHNLTT